jgi:hypothetical protein
MRFLASFLLPLLVASVATAQGTMNFSCNDQSGTQTKCEVDLNQNPTGVEEVWVDGTKLNGSEWSSTISGTKVKVTFTNAPKKNKEVVIKIKYGGSVPTVQGHTWS